MLDSIIVGAIVAVAALFVGRRIYKQFNSKSSCGCSGCTSDTCCGSSIKESPEASCCNSNN